MSCIPFWLDDPITAIKNLRAILPRKNQCINEKLNSLSFFSVLFSVFLWIMKVPYAWAFGVFGLLISIILKLVFFDNDKGEMTYDEYNSRIKVQTIGDISRYLPTDGDEPEFQNLSEDVHFIKTTPYQMDGVDLNDWDQIKNSVTDDLLKSRIPLVVPLTRLYGDICVV